jgi:hypothetical protein
MMNEKQIDSLHYSSFITSLEPVAQKDQSAGLRSLRPHVRVVPGSLFSGVV